MKEPREYLDDHKQSMYLTIAVILIPVVLILGSELFYTSFSIETGEISVKSSNGLIFKMETRTTSIIEGGTMSIVLREINPTEKIVNIASSNEWAIPYLTLGPCYSNYPIGVAVFRGFVTQNELSSHGPLNLFRPGVYDCNSDYPVSLFSILPRSDHASATPVSSSNPVLNLTLGKEILIYGYWDGIQFIKFKPGVYTLIGGDEWGALAIIHFTIYKLLP